MTEDHAPFILPTHKQGQGNKLVISLFFLFLLTVALVFGSSAQAAPREFLVVTPRKTATATPTVRQTGVATSTAVPTDMATATPTATVATETATPTSTAATETATPTQTATALATATATGYATPASYSTGFRSPAAQAANGDGDGNGYERNPANAFSDDGLPAIDKRSGSSNAAGCDDTGKDRHDFYNYGFFVPAGAVITGLEVRLDAHASDMAGSPRLCVELSWDRGNSWTAARETGALTVTEATYLLGGLADRWDYPWNISHLGNAAFRLRVSNVASSTNQDFGLDWVGVNVYYDLSGPPPTATVTPTPMVGVGVPLMDMGTATYLGFSGGLYPGGSNEMPADHAQAGLARASLIEPLDTAGNPAPDGKIILLSIGMSNTAREFGDSERPMPWTFTGMVAGDPATNQESLILINGARSGQDAPDWDSPNDYNYNLIRDSLLLPNGMTEEQVQIVWLKVANGDASSHPSLPSPDADAYVLMSRMGDILRALKSRYLNLQQVFISSRVYAGYAGDEPLNPEPYAYESGYTVKWLIEAQIEQMATGVVNEVAGDLDYDTAVPWIAWGPYMWADGDNPRSDGLVWLPKDFAPDGTHPFIDGQRKVAEMLLAFFKNSPLTQGWFLGDGN